MLGDAAAAIIENVVEHAQAGGKALGSVRGGTVPSRAPRSGARSARLGAG